MSALPTVFDEPLRRLASQGSFLQARSQELLSKWQSPPTDAKDWIDLMLATERVVKIGVAGRENDAALIKELDAIPPRWNNAPDLPCDNALQKRLAEQMMQSVELWPAPQSPVNKQVVSLVIAPVAKRVGEMAVRHCLDYQIPVDLRLDDGAFQSRLVNALSDEEIDRLVAFTKKRYASITKSVAFYGSDDDEPPPKEERMDAKKSKRLAVAGAEFSRRVTNDEVRWVLTMIPSVQDANRDNLPYREYLKLFFESCDQPWEAIEKAQGTLIEAFNNGKQLHFTNSDGTDLRMSIEDHTFANSITKRNVPGSEFFSGPVKESVNGTLVAKGNFVYGGHSMRDITLTFERGEVVKATAGAGEKELNEILSIEDNLDPTDPKYRGARRCGEIGIGTNAYLREHLANALLVEKISGSFHIALGETYGNSYLGKPVKMDNGNKSDIHWDITTMLRGKDGEMWLDGHLLQKNGKWLPCPELGITKKDIEVLNDGWKAIPKAKRPEYWAKQKPAATQGSLADRVTEQRKEKGPREVD